MPSVATGANAANRELLYIGISGDGDSLSIGLGQFCHAVRRNINVLYLLENNGVYGLTKGQFSASADIGSRAKKGEPNLQQPIDPAVLALALGCTFVARSFSGDKEQLVPILKAALAHQGFAFVDVISPCVTFNDHEGSTKSYNYTRDHLREAVEVDFVEAREEIAVSYPEGEVTTVVMHDGSRIRLRKVGADYDIHDRDAAYAALRGAAVGGEVLTGILHVASGVLEMHQLEKTPAAALTALPHETLCPGAAELDRLMERFR
jgi:2-oxoglutarate ferredoxin oxidoreductase subunit beta